MTTSARKHRWLIISVLGVLALALSCVGLTLFLLTWGGSGSTDDSVSLGRGKHLWRSQSGDYGQIRDDATDQLIIPPTVETSDIMIGKIAISGDIVLGTYVLFGEHQDVAVFVATLSGTFYEQASVYDDLSDEAKKKADGLRPRLKSVRAFGW